MTFNTAIFYDIENLIGGYGKADMLSSLSLKDINNEIQRKDIGKIAIQRAYANWSDTRLNILQKAMFQKLQELLGSVNNDIFTELIC